MAGVGQVLMEFRRERRLSQLELALQAEVSTRHISFIETGRSRPSREMLLRLAAVMGLAHRDCNLLMTASGYAPAYSDLALDEAAMGPVMKALTVMLENHAPFPAAVLDSTWNLRMMNLPMQQLMRFLVPADRSAGPVNILELIFADGPLRQAMVNWDEVAALLLRRLRLQLQASASPELSALFTRLVSLAPPPGWRQPTAPAEGPMLTTNLVIAGQPLSLFSTLSTFGTALDAGLQELMIESYFPADERTRQFLLALAQAVPGRQ